VRVKEKSRQKIVGLPQDYEKRVDRSVKPRLAEGGYETFKG